jgi:hypothetical protein
MQKSARREKRNSTWVKSSGKELRAREAEQTFTKIPFHKGGRELYVAITLFCTINLRLRRYDALMAECRADAMRRERKEVTSSEYMFHAGRDRLVATNSKILPGVTKSSPR